MITIANVKVSSEEIKDLLVYYALIGNVSKFKESYELILASQLTDNEIYRTFELIRRALGLPEILQSGVY